MRWKKKSTPRARRLRRRSTQAERILWAWLRADRLLNSKWRRQHPAGFYFLDFACPMLMLGVELDGAHHLDPRKANEDAVRTKELEDQGWKILRFRTSKWSMSFRPCSRPSSRK